MHELYLTCPRGLEQPLYDETKNIIKNEILIGKGGIQFKGTLEDIYRINYKTRIGMNLHLKLFDGYVNNYNELYKLIYSFPWHKTISPEKTFSIKAKINSPILDKSNFCTMRIKDAIVDRIRKEKNNRPSIDKKKPDFYIFVYINNKKINVYLNSSGWPLFMRGYKSKIHKASLNEALAAGILKLSNWEKEYPLYDPMCGSGTLLIEAALDAFNIPPRILRNMYAFKNWNNFDEQLWTKISNEENSKITYSKIQVYGSDHLANNIKIAKNSLERLELTDYVNFETKDFKEVTPNKEEGYIITNPPYGYRIGEIEELHILYKEFGDHLKNNFNGFSGYIFTGNLELLKSIGLRTKKKIILKNGMIDCRLAYYPLKSGKY